MDSYDTIVERMNGKFTELAGYPPDSASDIGIRIKVLAGEIYSVSCALEWLKRQTFAQTASGDGLEQRALERGLKRKPPTAAQGTLTFSISSALWFPAEIPEGTVCTTGGDEPLRYVVTKDTFIPAGSLCADAPAKAETAGAAGNTAAKTVLNMVTPPASIEKVENKSAFTGGEDAETDEALRARLLASYAEVSTGTNAAWYRETALKYGGVHSANVVPRSGGVGTVAVYLGGKGCAPPAETVDEIRAYMNGKREINTTVTVEAAETVPVDVTVSVTYKDGFKASEVRKACTEAVNEYFCGLGVGGAVVLSAMGAGLFSTGMIADCSFSSSGKEVTQSQLAVPGTVKISPKSGG
ncbi:MAG TPA: baseplate protein J [Ruminococcaceae bacterium]|nr:baseplate protein J [Oscillospiraceae bacterium]